MGISAPLLWVVVVLLLTTLPPGAWLPNDPGGPAAATPVQTAHVANSSGLGRPDLAPRPIVGGGQGRILVNTSDTNAVPNDGLRMNLTAFPAQNLPADSSFQVAVEEGIGGYEAVFGLFQNTRTFPTAFFSIFTNQTNQNVRLGYWPALPIIPGDAYDFVLAHANGTNWTLTVNRAPFGGAVNTSSFDFGATRATFLTSVSFSEVAIYQATSTVPGLLDVPLALAVHHPTGWYLPQTAAASFVGTTGARWGVQGRLQHPTLAPGELETGSTVANVTDGTVLWTGGPIPVRVSIGFTISPAVATSPVEAIVTVTQLSGSPIPGVSIYLGDSLNGSFSPATVVTNSSGGALGLLETPNVTSPTNDLVLATVTLFGYTGSTGLALPLTPAVQVFLSANPSSPKIAPRGQLTVTFTATNLSGDPLSGLLLSFSVDGPAGLSPRSGATDSGGRLTVTVTAPPGVTEITVVATVDGVGEWGHGSVRILVAPPAPSFWTQYGTSIVGGTIVVGLAAVALLLLRRSRRRRQQLPNMPLRRYIQEAKRPGPPGGEEPPPVNRTPP